VVVTGSAVTCCVVICVTGATVCAYVVICNACITIRIFPIHFTCITRCTFFKMILSIFTAIILMAIIASW
jgi:hypothetical protein